MRTSSNLLPYDFVVSFLGMAKGGGEMAVPSKRVKLESPASRGKSSAIEEMETDAKVPSSTASVPDPVDISVRDSAV